MKLKIVGIIDRGIPQKERLHLLALADANLNYYTVFDTIGSGDLITATPKRAYWFADYEVKAGDHVILYTKNGNESTGKRTDGGTNHFFYWGLNGALWGSKGSCAVLIEINLWETSDFGK